jgi:hypothetical protein
MSVASNLRWVAVGVVLLALSACDQPKPNCNTVSFPYAYAAKLMELSRDESDDGACSGFGPQSFYVDPELGYTPYFARDSSGQPDYARASLAVQSAELGALREAADAMGVENQATDGKLYSLGDFTSGVPDSANLCHVPSLSPTHLVLDALPAVPDDPTTDEDDSVPAQPAVDIRLEWSNVDLYTVADAVGTQIQANLVDTRQTDSGATCTINYKVLSLAPSVACRMQDDDGNDLQNDDGTYVTDPGACDPEANPAEMRYSGSGLGDSVRFVCDPMIGFCVLDGDSVPALK